MQLSIYFFEPPFLPLLHLIWLINSLPPPPPNGCNHTCLEPRPQKVSVEDQGLGSTNYINSYYCVSPRPSATLLQVTYPTHLFLPLSHHPHFVLMFTSLPTSPQEHSFFTCFFGVWYKLLLPDHLRSSYALPLLLLKTMAKGCHTALCLFQPHLNITFLYARL